MVDHAAIAEAEMMAEEPYNAADEKQVNNARKKEARERREELDFVRGVLMATPAGRKWTLNLLNTCKIFGNPIIIGDPYCTYSNIGEQNVGKKYLQDINDAAPDLYVLMMKEAKENKKK